MTPKAQQDRETILRSRVGVPDHVVRRAFANEVVVLNLSTGQYHGLNPTAGRMLDALQEQTTVRDAASALADEFSVSDGQIENDIVSLCSDLLDRGLIALDPAPGAA